MIGALVECKATGNIGVVVDAGASHLIRGVEFLVRFANEEKWLRFCTLEVIK